jgi:hypothetical protein
LLIASTPKFGPRNRRNILASVKRYPPKRQYQWGIEERLCGSRIYYRVIANNRSGVLHGAIRHIDLPSEQKPQLVKIERIETKRNSATIYARLHGMGPRTEFYVEYGQEGDDTVKRSSIRVLEETSLPRTHLVRLDAIERIKKLSLSICPKQQERCGIEQE